MISTGITVLLEFFPRGISHYLIGGLLIGFGVSFIYLFTGLIPGASTFLESSLSYVSKAQRFQRYRASRDWRVVFTVGIVLGAGIYLVVVSGEQFVTEVQPWRLALGGVLIGFGTRLGKGCTSGHGICGVSSVSRASFVNVAIFMAIAIATAFAVASFGVVP